MTTLVSSVFLAGAVAAAPTASADDWCLDYWGCEPNRYRHVEKVDAIHVGTGSSIRVQLDTQIKGRRAYPTLIVQHISGPPVTVEDIHINCQQDKGKWFDLGCGVIDVGQTQVPTGFVGGIWNSGRFEGSYLRNGAPYYFEVTARLTAEGHAPEAHTLLKSATWVCDSTLNEGGSFVTDRDSCHF